MKPGMRELTLACYPTNFTGSRWRRDADPVIRHGEVPDRFAYAAVVGVGRMREEGYRRALFSLTVTVRFATSSFATCTANGRVVQNT